jgi:predicted TIM-barrel fold metal-dependent hydrolase
MDGMNMKALINYSSPADRLETILKEMAEPHPGRYITCIQPSYKDVGDPDYPARQAEEIRNGYAKGARGLKISKGLGLGVRENGEAGPLIKVDDPRLDPMWEEAGKLKMPVFIHVSDPDAFFIPVDRFNERWDELGNHPNWSFYGDPYPPKQEILAARNRVIERHPNTHFVGLHVANRSENLDEVSGWLDKYQNFHCEIGARIGELGRQPRRSRRFFEEYQDRIMFGTDASPNSPNVPQQILTPEMYHCYFRFLETLDEYFDYSPSPVGPQGRWKIYGVGLPDGILKKVYPNNAARLLGLEAI